jgi:hypothetical protein
MTRLIYTAAAAALFVFAPLSKAQFGPNNLYSPSEVSALVDRVHEDLNRAYSAWHVSDSERDRLNHAEKELREFADKWSKTQFDKGKLDDAIDAIQHVLDSNKLPGRERDALSDDVERLRRMRTAYERHEIG